MAGVRMNWFSGARSLPYNKRVRYSVLQGENGMRHLIIAILPLISPILLILLVFGITMLFVRKKERRYKQANPRPDNPSKNREG
jgi:hypothetical protein